MSYGWPNDLHHHSPEQDYWKLMLIGARRIGVEIAQIFSRADMAEARY